MYLHSFASAKDKYCAYSKFLLTILILTSKAEHFLWLFIFISNNRTSPLFFLNVLGFASKNISCRCFTSLKPCTYSSKLPSSATPFSLAESFPKLLDAISRCKHCTWKWLLFSIHFHYLSEPICFSSTLVSPVPSCSVLLLTKLASWMVSVPLYAIALLIALDLGNNF